MRLLITGATGLLGSEIARIAHAGGLEVTGCFHDRPAVGPWPWRPLEMTDPESVTAAVGDFDVVVHTAYSRDGDSSRAINVGGTEVLAQACERIGTRLIHISSDAVFAGEPPRPTGYRESDDVHPVPGFVYGREKADAETALRTHCPTATMVRTTLLYDLAGSSSLEQLVTRSVEPGSTISHFGDEFRCPVHVQDVAEAVVTLATMVDGRGPEVIHLGGPTRLSRYEIAATLALHASIDPGRLRLGRSTSMGVPRPRDLNFDSSLAWQVLGFKPRPLTPPSD